MFFFKQLTILTLLIKHQAKLSPVYGAKFHVISFVGSPVKGKWVFNARARLPRGGENAALHISYI